VEITWMMLANHAEAPPNGLLYISGGAWDTVNVLNPLPAEAPEGAVAFIEGVLVIRLRFHQTETERDYPFRLSIIDEDGAEIGHVDGDVRAERVEGHPPAWPHPANMIVSLTGLPLPRFGEYRISLEVNRDHKGEIPFRAVRRY
jgi:hypothetical protein